MCKVRGCLNKLVSISFLKRLSLSEIFLYHSASKINSGYVFPALQFTAIRQISLYVTFRFLQLISQFLLRRCSIKFLYVLARARVTLEENKPKVIEQIRAIRTIIRIRDSRNFPAAGSTLTRHFRDSYTQLQHSQSKALLCRCFYFCIPAQSPETESVLM